MQLILRKKNANTIDRTFDISEGSTYTENYNETLDSANIRLSHITSHIDIEPFDEVILHDENGNLPDKYMCVDSYTETMECLDPHIYSYEISLFSETKKLENTLLPNLSITKLSTGFRSIWYYLNKYIQLYAPKKRMRISNDITITDEKPLTGFNQLITEDVRFDLTEEAKQAFLNNTYHYVDLTVDRTAQSPDSFVKVNSSKIVVEENDAYVIANITHEWKSVIQPRAKMTMSFNYYTDDVSQTIKLVPAYKFSIDTINLFKNINCPEMQWNCPTLREVLNDLMMVKDCIVSLKNNTICHINLTETKNPVDTSKVNYIQNSQSSEDYVSELKMDMLNVMQTSLDGVKQTVNRMEYQTFKASSDGYVVTDENMILKTEYPILKVNHLWMIFQAFDDLDINGTLKESITMFKVDLCDLLLTNGQRKKLVYEYQEYSVLPQRRYNPTNFNEINQNISVYFHREGKTIEGWYNLSKLHWIFNTKETALTILKRLIAMNCYDIDGNSVGSFSTTLNIDNVVGYFSTFFIIEYETTADAVFKASKDIAPTHHREVTDNQTNAYVDAYNQGFMEYQKVNRLGNKQLYINARYQDDFEDIIKIGDYYEDNIIYQTTYQIYKNHIEVNAVATKNYILRDYYTGVKARIRSWKIADVTQSFTRHDLEKYYLEFSKSEKLEYTTYNENLPQYFLSPLVSGYIRPLKYCICLFTDNSGTTYGWYAAELLGRIIGNSIVFTFGIDDNFGVGKTVSNELTTNDMVTAGKFNSLDGYKRYITAIDSTFTSKYGGVPLKDASYVDNNGEFRKIEYKFAYDKLDADFPQVYKLPGESGAVPDADDQKEWMLKQCQLPYITPTDFTSYLKYTNTKFVYKDNREMPKISTQFELCSDSHDIIFTRKFLELQECIRELTSEESKTTQETFSHTCSVSDFQQFGGPVTTEATVEPPYNAIDVGGVRIYQGTYEFLVPSLYGKTMDSLSIENTVAEANNTVNFDGNYSYVHPITGQTEYAGRFYGTIHTYSSNQPQSANITYTTSDAPVPYWRYVKAVNMGLAGQRVTNIQVSGWTPTGSDELEVTFNQQGGSFRVYILTYTQPVSDINLTITYDLVLQDGSYVSNVVKVYQDNKSNFDWRNPQLGNATVLNKPLLFTHGSKSSKITISDAPNPSEHVYYITDVNDNILLAVKGTNEFYLNCLLSRDYNIYDNDGDVVGSI